MKFLTLETQYEACFWSGRPLLEDESWPLKPRFAIGVPPLKTRSAQMVSTDAASAAGQMWKHVLPLSSLCPQLTLEFAFDNLFDEDAGDGDVRDGVLCFNMADNVHILITCEPTH